MKKLLAIIKSRIYDIVSFHLNVGSFEWVLRNKIRSLAVAAAQQENGTSVQIVADVICVTVTL